MLNLIVFVVIAAIHTIKKTALSRVVFCFYLLYYSIYLFDHFYGLSFLDWTFLNIVSDLIIIALCYNEFTKGSALSLLYMIWVMVAYLLPELLSLNGIIIKYNESEFMCVIDILFVMSELANVDKSSCRGNYRRDSSSGSNHLGRNKHSKE